MSEEAAMNPDRPSVIEYLDAMAHRDWGRLATTIAEEGLWRSGPYEDVVEGKEAYVAFLAKSIDRLENYRLDVRRVSPVGDRVTYVELTESCVMGGTDHSFPEICLFETDDRGQIVYVSVFMKTASAMPGRSG